MFLTSFLFLSLLPTLISAKSVPRANDAKTHPPLTICLPNGIFGSTPVVFNGPGREELFYYAIVTKYTTYYPTDLAHALVSEGYNSIGLSSDILCDWQKLKSVHGSLGLDFNNHRGDIYWKPNPTHIPSSIDKVPSEDTINHITRILIKNPPAGDVYMFSTIILAWATSLLGYILFMVLLMSCIKKSDRNKDKSMDKEDHDDIELESIKAPDTDNLARTTAAASPFEDLKYIYGRPHTGSTTSTDTTRSEPLPTYSRQEPGYGSRFDDVCLG
jgi:hypothetical protein